jgi:multimeric flavodoxin WrbA
VIDGQICKIQKDMKIKNEFRRKELLKIKILGISCGRKMGNSEILLKEALMAAAECGAEYEMIRLMDLNIKPCIGCNSCIMDVLRGGKGDCILTGDDMPFYREKFLECDGIIVSTPVFNNTAPGYFRLLGDRCGPAFDRENKRFAKKLGADIDERWFKPRVAAWIVVGGGPPTHVHTALPLMFHFSKSTQSKQVDRFAATFCASPGQVLMHPEFLERAAQLGRNLASQLGKPNNEVEWLGDDDFVCDNCRSTMVVVGKNNKVHCATCGRIGKMVVDENNNVHIEYDPNDLVVDDPKYREKHIIETGKRFTDFEEFVKSNKKLFDKYRNFGTFSKPPRP